jgi:hypothetical protein
MDLGALGLVLMVHQKKSDYVWDGMLYLHRAGY